MKKKLALSIVILFVFTLALSGCAAFAFNPIGRWNVAEERFYEDDVLKYTKDVKDFEFGGQTALVFKKTGTGYIDSGTKNNIPYTYEYTDDKVTISLEYSGSSSTAAYDVGENGTILIATTEDYNDTTGGKNVHCKKQTIFRRQ